MKPKIFFFLLLVGALALPGCSGTGEISGVVKHKGQPVSGGTIVFHDGDKRSWAATIGTDGTYSVANVPTGNAKVTVQSALSIPLAGSQTAKVRPVSVPDKYNRPDSSGLTFEVQAGSQTKDWDLTD
jgi:hypothetical protein